MDKTKKLEELLLEFIEKEIKEPSTGAAVAAIPEMARVLIELWEKFSV